jgi:hypothetical protein
MIENLTEIGLKHLIANLKMENKLLKKMNNSTIKAGSGVCDMNDKLKKGIENAISNLEYSANNLIEDEILKESIDGTMESTCPSKTLLIEIRDLKELLNG